MSYYEVGTVRSYLKRHAPKMCPDIYNAFLSLSEDDQEVIIFEIRKASVTVPFLGPLGALELLYKLGRFMNYGPVKCPTCGRSYDATN